MNDESKQPDKPKRPNILQVLQSIIGAAFGVQTEAARQRDFQHGSPAVYIIGGIVFTVLFIIAVIVIVNIVLSNAT